MNAEKEVRFYFDFSSPFAYLGATQIERVARSRGARVAYRPFLLGALFRQVGTPDVPFLAMNAAKSALVGKDLTRWAEHWGVPFTFASRFPVVTVKPLRMVLATPEARRGALVEALFRASWAEDRDVADDAELARVADDAGFDGAALVASTRDPALKDALRAATDEARAIGLFGAPSFAVGDLLFWGQDRLEFVARALDGWRPAQG